MSTLLALGLANAACAALLAVPAYLVGRFTRRPALAHALWLLVLLKLVTPPMVRPGLAWLPAENEPRAPAQVARLPEPVEAPLTTIIAEPPRVNFQLKPATASAPETWVGTQARPMTVVGHPKKPETPPSSLSAPVEDERHAGVVELALVVWVAGAL